MKKIMILLLTIALFTTGCSVSKSQNIIDKDANVAKTYLEKKNYKVASFEGNVQNYNITKEKLLSMPYSMYWGLQTGDVSKFLNKDVKVEKFIVTNHPLDNWESQNTDPKLKVKSKGKTDVWVFVIDGQAVGGYSYPVLDEGLISDVWSIDGKTLEEVHAMSYKDWSEQWNANFGK